MNFSVGPAGPIRQFEARVTKSSRVGSWILAIFFLALGLAPRWIGPVQGALMKLIGPPDPNYAKLEFYNNLGWIIFTVLGVGTLVQIIRAIGGNDKAISGTVAVYPDRLEAQRTKGGPKVIPFAATPYVRDVKSKSSRWLELFDPETGKKFEGIGPGLFAGSQYNELSATLQRAHSDFWLGADFPASIGRLDLDFYGGFGSDRLSLRQGTLFYKETPIPAGALTEYRLYPPIAGLSMDQTAPEITVRFTIGDTAKSASLSAGAANHKLSLIRILDAWGVPRAQPKRGESPSPWPIEPAQRSSGTN